MTLTTGQTGALLRSRKETKSHVREANILNSAIYYDLADANVSQRVQDCTKVSINEILNCQKINSH